MSDENKKSLLEFPDSVDNAIKNLSEKPSKSIGETFNDLLFLIFGDLHNKAEMRRMRYSAGLEKFKKELDDNINQIPTERLLEPNTRIVLPALDASKYAVEEENLRKMFARLISKSLDSDYSKYVHPAFITIIKDMSSLDAENLALFKEKSLLPVANYRIIFSTGESSYFQKNVFLSNPNNIDISTQSVSISMLLRLGLVKVDFDGNIPDESLYDGFSQTDKYKEMQQIIENYLKIDIEEINKSPQDYKNNIELLQDYSLEIEKGYIELTDLGKEFLKICL